MTRDFNVSVAHGALKQLKILHFFQDHLLKRDLDCHFELETVKHGKKYGFFVVIDEMQLDEDEEKHSSGNQEDRIIKDSRCSSDYVQFGRDNFVVTTKTSEKFCGDFKQV